MTWIGRKKLALVPVFRPNAHPPDQIPDDWNSDILRRVLFDPDPRTGADRSLRAYIHAASSGLADLDAVVKPVQVIDQQDVPPNALEAELGSRLREQGFHSAAIVMLGGPGAGSTIGFWARFVMQEGVGVWAMEFMHSLTGFGDLYPFGGNMGGFDEMACSCGTHPSTYTKAAIGWLDASAIAQHTDRFAGYDLHAVGLVQPPPSGRSTAVRIGSQVPYLMVEARQKVDQFDRNVPSEGVIVYRVQTSDPLGHAQHDTAPVELLTTSALTPGQAFTSDTNVSVSVTGTIPGGFSVNVTVPDPSQLPWTSVSEGRSTPGAPVTAVVTGPNRVALFLADPSGGIYTTSGSAAGGWAPWTSVSEGRSTPGAPVTAVVTGPNRVALFLADPNGGIYTTSGSAAGGWAPWTSVSEGRSTPGGRVAAVVTGPNRVALFLTDPAGGTYTTSGAAGGWAPWSFVAIGTGTPGAPVTAVATGSNRFALFLTAPPSGKVLTASGSTAVGWTGWDSVSDGASTLRAPIAAVVTGPNRVALFLADANGGIYTTSGNPTDFTVGWAPWTNVSEGRSTPGAPVAAVVTGANRVALFLADPDGGIYTTLVKP